VRLYDLAGEWAALADAADAEGGDVGDALARVDALGEALEAKAAGVLAVLRGLDAEAEACRAEEKRLAERRKAREAAGERLREYVRGCMDAAGIAKIATPLGTLALQASPARVEVVDEAAVPEEFVRVKREVDKRAVLAAYKAEGLIADGCAIHDGERHLRVR
jgi:phage host-nuclease inhibitor protein Gam